MVLKKIDKQLRKNVDSHKKGFIRVLDYLSGHPGKSLLILILLILLSIGSIFIHVRLVLFFALIISLYILIWAIAFLRKGLGYLFHNEGNVRQMISGYAIAVIGILVLFTAIYSATDNFHVGYLTYGHCSEHISPQAFLDDSERVDTVGGKFYFSAVTLFTIGYGDICPMGWNKGVAIINGFIGSVMATIILGIALARYLEYHRKRKEDE